MIVHFSTVGRRRHSWTANIPNPSLENIATEAKKNGPLYSSDVTAHLNSDRHTGTIYVGLCRAVGIFAIENNSS